MTSREGAAGRLQQGGEEQVGEWMGKCVIAR